MKLILTTSLILSHLIIASALAVNTPINGVAHPAGPKTIALSWTDNASDESGYEVQRHNGAAWEDIATLPANSQHFYDRNSAFTPESTHQYQVRATGSPNSSWLALGSATTTMEMNIIFFLADDMGYKDIVGLRNPEIDGPTIYETPAIDTLISQSLSINNAYCSGPRCVVARRCIQTGKYDWRPESIPNNNYYVGHDDQPIGGGIWAGGTTVAGSKAGAGVTIPYDNVTYGEAVQAAGYRTCFIGKYHLGESPSGTPVTGYTFGDKPSRGPNMQGYDVSIAAGHAGAPPASYFSVENTYAPGTYTFELPDMDGATYGTAAPVAGEYITDRMTVKAIGFMADALANHSTQPFHLTLAHYAVHTPAEAKLSDINYFKTRKSNMAAELATHPMAASPLATDYSTKTRQIQDNVVYAAMMKSYDDSLASLRSYLTATDDPRHPGKKLSETTIIVVSSDHGGKSTTPLADNKSLENDATDPVNPPATFDAAKGAYKAGTSNAYSAYPTSNYPYRQGKTWVYEGGLKVPLIIYVPGVTTANTRSDAFVHHADLFATFCDMSGAPQQPTESTDSISFMLTAAEPAISPRTELHHFFTNANKGTGNPALAAYRRGDYKLLYYIVQRKLELYNLAADISEKNDLSESRPDLAEQMFQEIYQQALSTGMKMPKPGSNSWTSEVNDVLLRNGIIASIPAAPDAAPTWDGTDVTQISDSTIELNWVVNATNATHSVIYRTSVPDGETSYREHAFVPAGVTTFRDANLAPGGTYKYRVESENLGGWAAANTGNKTMTLTSAANLAIVANDDSITTVPGERREFHPLNNDEGEGVLIITAISTPTAGTATTDGTRIYFQASDDFAGSVTMTYDITDSAAQTDSATVTFTLPIAPPNEELREAWMFNDAINTDLNDLENSGSLNSTWNLNTTDATDGTGNFVLVGDSGTTTRKLPKKGTANALPSTDFYATPIISGKYRVEIKFASWDVNQSSVGDAFTLRLNDASGSMIANITLELNASNINIRFGSAGGNYENQPYSLVEASTHTIAIDFDFDNDTVDYLVDGTIQHSFTFTGSDLGQLVYAKSGTWATSATSVKIDHIKLIEFVAPSSLYDAWATTHPWLGILDQDPADDPDGDGIKNIIEFAFGTSPTQNNAQSDLGITLSPSGDTISFTPWRDTAALYYDIQFSDDLTTWNRTDTFASIPVTTPAGTPVNEPLPTGNRVFSRINISTP